MAGISSKALAFGGAENKYKFNGIEQNTDFDINMYDAFYRNLDPQTGRFWQIDPKPNTNVSPYSVMDNNPVFNIDPLGDTIMPSDAVKNNSAAFAAFNLFKKSEAFKEQFGKYDIGGEGSFFGGEAGGQSQSNLVFDLIDNPKAGGLTTVEVQGNDGNWQKVNDGAKYDPSTISADSKTRITIAADFNTHKTVQGYANTFNHEGSVHAVPFLKTLDVLRNAGTNAFVQANALSMSFTSADFGKGLLNRGYNLANLQHGRVAAGDNPVYNAIKKELRQQMSPASQKNYDKVVNENLSTYQSATIPYRAFLPKK